MEVKLIKSVRMDKNVQNYDYSKFAVYDDEGKYCGQIFEHDGEFLTLKTPSYYPDKETAAASLVK